MYCMSFEDKSVELIGNGKRQGDNSSPGEYFLGGTLSCFALGHKVLSLVCGIGCPDLGHELDFGLVHCSMEFVVEL